MRIAITKGRLLKKSIELFEKSGMDCEALRNPGRRLIIPVDGHEAVLAKAPDVITYVEHGVCDFGIVGRDTVLESQGCFTEVLDLGFGACRFMLAVKEGVDFFGSLHHRTVASKYPNVTGRYFEKLGLDIDIIHIEGSVELAPLLGLADGIVDIVETGDTLRENGLIPIAEVETVSARLIANIGSMKTRKAEMNAFIERCEEALA